MLKEILKSIVFCVLTKKTHLVKHCFTEQCSICVRTVQYLGNNQYVIFLNAILFAICTSTFSKLCVTYTVTCRRELSSAPL
jgi:hypothetical protein